MATRKIVSKDIAHAATSYVGVDGEIWVDTVTNLLKVSDGTTPGGAVITTDGTVTTWANIADINNASGPSKIAIGENAGATSQGAKAVAIGYFAGDTNQHANSIVINASGTALQTTQASSLVIKPIRNVTMTTILGYDATSGEVMHNAAIPGYISLADLKTEVAASADFAAFKARIAAL